MNEWYVWILKTTTRDGHYVWRFKIASDMERIHPYVYRKDSCTKIWCNSRPFTSKEAVLEASKEAVLEASKEAVLEASKEAFSSITGIKELEANFIFDEKDNDLFVDYEEERRGIANQLDCDPNANWATIRVALAKVINERNKFRKCIDEAVNMLEKK